MPNPQTNEEDKSGDIASTQDNNTVPPAEEDVPAEKTGFPPYNYVPTEKTEDVVYDLDSTTTETTGEAKSQFWRKFYKPDKTPEYLQLFGLILFVFSFGFWTGRSL